jgi:two-component system chemotaxis sensor kinase CheA
MSQELNLYVLFVSKHETPPASLKSVLIDLKLTFKTFESAESALQFLSSQHENTALIGMEVALAGDALFDFRKSTLAAYDKIPFFAIGAVPDSAQALKALQLKISSWLTLEQSGGPPASSIQQIKDRVASVLEERELKAGFLVDVQNLVEEMEAKILSLDPAAVDVDIFNRIYACAHTIKGSSGFFQPDRIHRFTHAFEDYISAIKKDFTKFHDTDISKMLKALDIIKVLLQEFSSGEPPAQTLETITSMFKAPLEEAAAPAAAAAAPKAAPRVAPPAPAEELRVGVGVLNEFMEKSSEVTVLRNMLNMVLRKIEASYDTDSNISHLSELMQEMHKNISAMQEKVGDLKKVPLTQVLRPLERNLRDLSHSLKKQINLSIEGGDLRIDNKLAELFGKCLIHLLRNSADHGIEDPAKRVSAGKPSFGTIKVVCRQSANAVSITISDDGRGIDPAAVKKKALESGIITAQASASISDSEAQLLIFAPGFSTAANVTDVSGRGVGTDMVRSTVIGAGGSLLLDSVPGKGTRFHIELPIPKSVSILHCLMIGIGAERFAIPQDSIERVISLEDSRNAAKIVPLSGERFFQEAGALLPVVNLQKLLAIPLNTLATPSNFLVQLRSRIGSFCVTADEINDAEENVVKRLDLILGKIPMYAGATFIGDGKLAMVLSADSIGEAAGISRTQKPVALLKAEESSVDHKQVLLFRVGSAELYGILQSQIFRIESLSGKNAIYLGGCWMIRMGQKVAVLMNVNSSRPLSSSTASPLTEINATHVILIEQKGQLFALPISDFDDFVECDLEQLQDVRETSQKFQLCLFEKKIIRIINVERLCRIEPGHLPAATEKVS